MFLHATAALRKRLRLADAECAVLASPAPVNSWYGHISRVHRRPTLALLHGVTRYTVILDGRGLDGWHSIHERWREALPRVMRTDGFSDRLVAAVMPASELQVGKATDKKILGTIVETFKSMNWHEDSLEDLVRLSYEFNHTPIIGGDHGFPDQCMRAFLAAQDPDKVELLQLVPARESATRARSKDAKKTTRPSRAASVPAGTHLGEWRITRMNYFADDVLGIVEPPGIEFRGAGRARMHFVALTADLDVQARRDGETLHLAWTWAGDDDGTEVSGRGDAIVRGDRMRGCVYIHRGDEMPFEAKRVRG